MAHVFAQSFQPAVFHKRNQDNPFSLIYGAHPGLYHAHAEKHIGVLFPKQLEPSMEVSNRTRSAGLRSTSIDEGVPPLSRPRPAEGGTSLRTNRIGFDTEAASMCHRNWLSKRSCAETAASFSLLETAAHRGYSCPWHPSLEGASKRAITLGHVELRHLCTLAVLRCLNGSN